MNGHASCMRCETDFLPPPASFPGAVAPVIEVAGLVKTYGRTMVVDHVNVQVAEGEIFGLLGANGAGKTTTVECLQGLRRADGGRLRVLGLDPVADRGRLRSMIGSQLQECALPDRLRAGEAVALFDTSRSLDPKAHLDQWGLADAVNTAFADLSGGQKQRLFIVLALLNEPKVVFLDELTQGLDPAARREVWQVIRQIRDRGTTVVLVSHFADEVEALCDRVSVMSNGQVIDTGTPGDLIDRHATNTTISFTPPISFDPDRLRAVRGVTGVERHRDQIAVSGTSTMVAAVCAATLDDAGDGPSDLHVTHPNLNDALVNLIGAHS
jgi:ABC-2 type transport system ATP-binding protein